MEMDHLFCVCVYLKDLMAFFKSLDILQIEILYALVIIKKQNKKLRSSVFKSLQLTSSVSLNYFVHWLNC